MIQDIKDKINKRNPKKRNVNFTLDETLILELEKFKKENQIQMLSPMVNEMLWSFLEEIKTQGKNKKNTKQIEVDNSGVFSKNEPD